MSKPEHAAPGQSFDCHTEFYKNSAYNKFPQEHRQGGSLGLRLMSVSQDPIDMIDAATQDLVITLTRTEQREVGLDAGDGLCVHRDIPRDTISVTPMDTEERFVVGAPHIVMTAALAKDRIAALFDMHGLVGEPWRALVGDMAVRPRIAGTIKTLWDRSNADGPQDGLYIDGLTLQLLAQLCEAPSLSPILDERADTRIVRVVDYIEAHVAEPLSVTELAAIATMSAGHFSRCFKASVGEPVWAYVQRRRCERAKDLLLHSREPLAEIAYRTGFANQAHMTTSVKERYGATPGTIRKDRA